MSSNFDIERIQQILAEAEKSLGKVPQLKQLKKATGLKIVWILMGAFLGLLVMIYVFSGLRALGTCVGVVYPAWCSLKAIKSTDKEDDTFWLAYWVIYGIFSAFESITDILLFWVPFYEMLKIVFYIFLFSPQFKGALTLYYAALEPLVSKLMVFEANAASAAKGVRDSMNKGSKKRT